MVALQGFKKSNSDAQPKKKATTKRYDLFGDILDLFDAEYAEKVLEESGQYVVDSYREIFREARDERKFPREIVFVSNEIRYKRGNRTKKINIGGDNTELQKEKFREVIDLIMSMNHNFKKKQVVKKKVAQNSKELRGKIRDGALREFAFSRDDITKASQRILFSDLMRIKLPNNIVQMENGKIVSIDGLMKCEDGIYRFVEDE